MPYNNPAWLTDANSVQTIKEGADAANENFAELALPNKAALRDVQTNATDTTAGRLMAVGAFGLGGHVILDGAIDFDTLTVGGDYFYSKAGETPLNGPPGSARTFDIGYLSVASGSTSDRATQTFTWGRYENANRKFTRTYKIDTNTWTPWQEIYHTGNILGTVSQSGGVPTGAIIERGSNSDGEYVKFADGTLFCWLPHTGLVASTENQTFTEGGLTIYSIAFDLTPPQTFVSFSAVSAAVEGVIPTSVVVGSRASVSGDGGIRFRLWALQDCEWRYSYMAIGRWW